MFTEMDYPWSCKALWRFWNELKPAQKVWKMQINLEYLIYFRNVWVREADMWTVLLFSPVGYNEVDWLRRREWHTQPHRSWQACVWERSCRYVPVGLTLPTGRSAKPQAAARQLRRSSLMVVESEQSSVVPNTCSTMPNHVRVSHKYLKK